ncbi:preprotein translocase subunit SecY [Thomasclavelia cocleata]|jgi:preprotein translocase subunit SecY|uniref:Protein translocase subunit SecY n=1 Tax=Thomasclavelia cocleata TaxID=69824 RepID=A0A1I0C8U0_9FIRM|nr:preprotein translocase subunit SecY [Thomasclavelia cocleata]MCI9131537.1 preprotein translocase subunit SecY [Thomasclavelia cocleata]MCI9630498.1 preprotein translocase subunit SecY [Thomasclavelia cocleata]MCR1959650.1 preprotein translocase subunit SecY [Thomasclavelia cocleata]NDO42273.1 preprotein translocase subunit SecY [Thomasclavelia cocleata]SET15808.1 protein translocase subunit secY/sec61 alpha [Thomasclavelia cocleata]
MFTFLKNVFKKGELRQKVIFTLGILFVYRLGAAITIPSVNTGALSSSDATNGIFGIMNLLGGGTLERFSLFSLGVSPYITSSIIIELLSMDVIPVLSQWRKEGNTGKKKKDRVTRYVTLFLAALQGGVLTYAFDNGYNILSDSSIWTYIYVVLVMMAGSMLAVWLGDQITNKGIGNGVSLLIFTGIVSNLPTSFISTFNNLVDTSAKATDMWLGIAWYALFVVVYLSIVIFVVFNEGAVRKIPIIYATSSNTTMRTKDQTHMPIKINSSGVIPVIFASSVLAAPRTIVSFMETSDVTKWINTIFNYQEPVGFILYILMIIGFTFFYSNLQIDAEKISDDLKKNGGSIPGVRTGTDTKNYIKKVLNRITVVGSLSLCIIAAIPIITPVIWSQTANASLSLGGTGLIIVTGVALETVKQIKTHITRKEYHGYIRR